MHIKKGNGAIDRNGWTPLRVVVQNPPIELTFGILASTIKNEYFDEIQDVKVTKNMLDLAEHIVNQKSGRFEPDKFEDQYETALIDLINQKRAGKPITPNERPRGENVVDLMEALRRSLGGAAAETKAPKKSAKKPRKPASGQKEMLMPIQSAIESDSTAAAKVLNAKTRAACRTQNGAEWFMGSPGILSTAMLYCREVQAKLFRQKSCMVPLERCWDRARDIRLELGKDYCRGHE
jgi:hypothetical protein